MTLGVCYFYLVVLEFFFFSFLNKDLGQLTEAVCVFLQSVTTPVKNGLWRVLNCQIILFSSIHVQLCVQPMRNMYVFSNLGLKQNIYSGK